MFLVANKTSGKVASGKVLTMPATRLVNQERIVRLSRLAMLIECEGSITIGMCPPTKTRNRPALRAFVGVTNTSAEIIEEAKATLVSENIGFIARPVRYGRGEGRKKRLDINLQSFERVVAVLTALMPYLRSKRAQAEIVLEFIASRQASPSKARYSEYEWQLVTEVRKLNGRMPGHKAIMKAKARLAETDRVLQPRTAEYFERYLSMCAELKSALQPAA
jgi:hypothetical protein